MVAAIPFSGKMKTKRLKVSSTKENRNNPSKITPKPICISLEMGTSEEELLIDL